MRATRALIHLDNFIHNLKEIRKFSSDKKMCVAVKANAYGHGAVECARAAVAFGADFLAVATVEEGIELRENGITAPLLMLSLCDPLEIDDAVKNRITPLNSSVEILTYSVFFKVNNAMCTFCPVRSMLLETN